MGRSIHDKRVLEIFNRPESIGIYDTKWSTKETRFIDGVRLIGEPDVIIANKNGLYVVEYKCNLTAGQRLKATIQLQRAEHFIREMGYEGKLEKLFVFGNKLEVEVMK